MSAPPDIAKKAALGGTRAFSGQNTNEKTDVSRMWADRQLLPPPKTGVHGWLYGRASYLRREGHDQLAALSELSAHVAVSTFRAGRTVTAREIADAIESVYRGTAGAAMPHHGSDNTAAAQEIADYHDETGWPVEMHQPRGKIDRERLDRVLHAGGKFELVDLWESASLRPADYPSPRWALSQLFSEADLLCVGYTSANFNAKPLRDSLQRLLVHPRRRPTRNHPPPMSVLVVIGYPAEFRTNYTDAIERYYANRYGKSAAAGSPIRQSDVVWARSQIDLRA